VKKTREWDRRRDKRGTQIQTTGTRRPQFLSSAKKQKSRLKRGTRETRKTGKKKKDAKPCVEKRPILSCSKERVATYILGKMETGKGDGRQGYGKKQSKKNESNVASTAAQYKKFKTWGSRTKKASIFAADPLQKGS